MPFDSGLLDHFDNGAWERSAESFLPYVGHISPGTVLLEDGSVMSMIALPGFAFELEQTSVRNARRRQLNTLFRAIADDNATLGIHFVRHARRDRAHRSAPQHGFARRHCHVNFEKMIRSPIGGCCKCHTAHRAHVSCIQALNASERMAR